MRVSGFLQIVLSKGALGTVKVCAARLAEDMGKERNVIEHKQLVQLSRTYVRRSLSPLRLVPEDRLRRGEERRAWLASR